MEAALLRNINQMIHKSHGIFLVTGPTGSGKTTTLYAALSRLNTREKNIITVEDPIEYQLAGVGQTQVNPKIDLTFANGLRSILRQDPDIIMIGEIRDGETAEIAVQSALTGHLVFSTLHTNDSAGRSPAWSRWESSRFSPPPRWWGFWPSVWCAPFARIAGRVTGRLPKFSLKWGSRASCPAMPSSTGAKGVKSACRSAIAGVPAFTSFSLSMIPYGNWC
jgi:energy-coupling factor transporter ATP-binding protein EcfA2